MNRKLKAKIVEHYGQQWRFAKSIGIHDSLLSKFVTGARDAPPEMQEKIAEKLDCPAKEIFPELNHAG